VLYNHNISLRDINLGICKTKGIYLRLLVSLKTPSVEELLVCQGYLKCTYTLKKPVLPAFAYGSVKKGKEV
jgi:hypothetical protein